MRMPCLLRPRAGLQRVGAGWWLGLWLAAGGWASAPTAGAAEALAKAKAKTAERSAPVDMSIQWFSPARPAILPRPGAQDVQDLKESSPPLGPSQVWQLSPADRVLSLALQRWSAAATWQLVWEADRDFPIEVEIQLQGHFSAVLEQVMRSLQDSDYPLQAVMNAQTRVLRIRRQFERRS